MKPGIGMMAGLFVTVLLMFPSAARAQSNGNQQGGDHPQLQAVRHVRVAACSFKSAGTTCSFSLGNQKFTGTCEATQDGQLACRNAVSKRGLNRNDDSFDSGMDAGDIPQ